MPAATPVLRFSRAVFGLGVCLTTGTGLALYVFSGHTADYWAWTIAAEPSAAFFGAGYLGAAVSLALAALAPEWRQARVTAVLAFTLTSLVLVVTLLNLEPFAFGEGGLTEAIAWVWIVVYAALPALVLAAFVVQERAGAREYGGAFPVQRWTQLLVGCPAAVVGALGFGLLLGSSWLSTRWPWPLTPLTAGIVGAWLITAAAGLLWSLLLERDWRRLRIVVLPVATSTALLLASAVRLRDRFDDGVSTVIYLAGLGALLVAFVIVAVSEESRSRAPVTPAEV